MKLKIVLPYGKETSIFEQCLQGIESTKEEFDVVFNLDDYKNIDPARTLNKEIVKDIENVDYFLFVDSDIGFNVSHVKQLLDRDRDIISCAYGKNLSNMTNDNQNVYVSGLWNGIGRLGYWLSMNSSGLKKVDWTGTGFLLVKSEVFKQIEHPYFFYPVVEFNGWKDYTSYDIGFYTKIHDSAFDVWCDCDCKVEHL